MNSFLIILVILVQFVESETTTQSPTTAQPSTTQSSTTSTTKLQASTTTSNQNVAKEVQNILKDNQVILFSKTYCPFSKGVKKILATYEIKNLKVVELDIHPNGKVIQDELEKISKLHTVPQLFVNGKFVGNFDMVSKMEKEKKMRPMLEEAKVIQPKRL